MSKNNFYIKNIIDIEKWQKLQDSLSLVTKMAIITVDYKGIPITSHSKCNDFCHCVRNDPKLAVLCQKCDARGGVEAVRLNHPYIYLCHFNLIDIAVPILVDGQYIGAFMAGQVKLQDPSDEGELEHILQSSEHFCNKTMLKDYQNIPILSYTEVKNIALMLSDLCDYIISEAMHKNLISQLYEQKQQIGRAHV